MSTIEIKQRIPSCIINKATIIKIAGIMDSEIEKISEKDKNYGTPKFDISIESKKRTVTIDNTNELESQEIPKDLKSIRIHFRKYGKSEDKDIVVHFGFQSWNVSEITVSGTDQIWVNGILGQIVEILTQNSTKNELLHNNFTKIPILLMISVLLGIVIYFFIIFVGSTEMEDSTFILDNLVFTIPIIFVILVAFDIIIPWIYPLVEFEDRGLQSKIRKLFLLSIATIVLGIVGSGIYEYISKINYI